MYITQRVPTNKQKVKKQLYVYIKLYYYACPLPYHCLRSAYTLTKYNDAGSSGAKTRF